MREVTPTRNAALELADERSVMRQGYEFLDEKRMLLATEIFRDLQTYQQRSEIFSADLKSAAERLAAAVERHGLDHLLIYPAAPEPVASVADRLTFLGVLLMAVKVVVSSEAPAAVSLDPSPEAQACRAAFERLLTEALDLGARAANLRRLAREYQRTERRAKALENVLLPEFDDAIKRIDEQLDTMDREETIRARWSAEGRRELAVRG